jgi:hypothetical protein
MIKSKTITDHKLLKDVHEESLQNPRQKQSVLVQPSGRAFEGVRTLLSVQQMTMKPSERQSNTVRMLELSASRPNDVATRLDDVQYFKIF